MRVAVLSDIHGNAPALRAVLVDAEAQGVNELWFLGDVLGYGPLPVTCIKLLDERSPSIWLMGNHDLGTLLAWEGVDIDDSRVRHMAPGREERQIFAWHALQLRVGLSQERVGQLRKLPTWQRVSDEIYAAHGAVLSRDPCDVENIGPNAYCHPWSPAADSMLDIVQGLAGEALPRLILVGHTHRSTVGKPGGWKKPRSWEWEDGKDLYESQDGLRPLPDSPDSPMIVCPGSVGQPRFLGGDQRAAYAILDLEHGTVHFRRVLYDEGEVKAAMVLVPKSESPQRRRWWSVVNASLANMEARGDTW
jgi:predicted phosphodiesterase